MPAGLSKPLASPKPPEGRRRMAGKQRVTRFAVSVLIGLVAVSLSGCSDQSTNDRDKNGTIAEKNSSCARTSHLRHNAGEVVGIDEEIYDEDPDAVLVNMTSGNYTDFSMEDMKIPKNHLHWFDNFTEATRQIPSNGGRRLWAHSNLACSPHPPKYHWPSRSPNWQFCCEWPGPSGCPSGHWYAHGWCCKHQCPAGLFPWWWTCCKHVSVGKILEYHEDGSQRAIHQWLSFAGTYWCGPGASVNSADNRGLLTPKYIHLCGKLNLWGRWKSISNADEVVFTEGVEQSREVSHWSEYTKAVSLSLSICLETSTCTGDGSTGPFGCAAIQGCAGFEYSTSSTVGQSVTSALSVTSGKSLTFSNPENKMMWQFVAGSSDRCNNVEGRTLIMGLTQSLSQPPCCAPGDFLKADYNNAHSACKSRDRCRCSKEQCDSLHR